MLIFCKHINRNVHLCIYMPLLYLTAYAQAAIECAHTSNDWNKASAYMQCQKPKYYHCLPDEYGRLIQKCFQRILVPKGMCPTFNSKSGQMDVYECQSSQNDCPSTFFWSNDVHNYQGSISTSRSPTLENVTLPTTLFLTSTTSRVRGISRFFGGIFDVSTMLTIVISIAAVLCVAILIRMVMFQRREWFK